MVHTVCTQNLCKFRRYLKYTLKFYVNEQKNSNIHCSFCVNHEKKLIPWKKKNNNLNPANKVSVNVCACVHACVCVFSPGKNKLLTLSNKEEMRAWNSCTALVSAACTTECCASSHVCICHIRQYSVYDISFAYIHTPQPIWQKRSWKTKESQPELANGKMSTSKHSVTSLLYVWQSTVLTSPIKQEE